MQNSYPRFIPFGFPCIILMIFNTVIQHSVLKPAILCSITDPSCIRSRAQQQAARQAAAANAAAAAAAQQAQAAAQSLEQSALGAALQASTPTADSLDVGGKAFTPTLHL